MGAEVRPDAGRFPGSIVRLAEAPRQHPACMPIRAVLFDLDGTLVDSLADIGDSMNVALEGMGLAGHPSSAYRSFVGDGVRVLAQRALPEGRRDDASVDACVARMVEVYGTRSDEKTRPYDGVPQLLDELQRRGLALAVLSNKPHDLTVALVAKLLGRWSFGPVFGERTGVPRKPDPSGALEAAGLLGIEPGEILYLGDTPIDMKTARAAGMPVLGVGWGFRDAAELLDAGAHAVVGHPLDVIGHLS